jgi:hypothetical protein
MALFTSKEGDPGEGVSGTLTQVFSKPIPVSCFIDESTFSISTNWMGEGCPPHPPAWKVEIVYTDDSSTVVDLSGDPYNSWTEHDLKAVLEAGKTVKSIRFSATILGWNPFTGRPRQQVYIDVCVCDILP